MGSQRQRGAVIFDLDGVITDTAEFHYQGWQRLADEEGIAFDRDRNEALRGLSRRESLLTMLGERKVDEDRLVEMMERKNRYYVDFLGQIAPTDPLPGAISLVVEAKRRGLLVAIGSSSRNARRVLARLELTDLFDAIADGDSVEHAKPAPDLFLAAAAMVGRPAKECVVVEDAGSGVDAALAAGMIAVGVGPAERVGHADYRFDTVADVDLGRVVPPRETALPDGATLRDGWVVVTDRDGVVVEDGLRYGDRRVIDTTGADRTVIEEFEPLGATGVRVRRERRGDGPWTEPEYEVELARHAIACERWWAEAAGELGDGGPEEEVARRRALLRVIVARARAGDDPASVRSSLQGPGR